VIVRHAGYGSAEGQDKMVQLMEEQVAIFKVSISGVEFDL
jgi:hypothetical protein